MPAIKLHKRLPNLSPKEEQIVTEMLCEMYASGFENGKPKWIPVTERLPEKGTGKVLIVKQYRGKPYIDVGEVINGEACCYADEYAIDPKEHKFTHWMPLPEEPKGE